MRRLLTVAALTAALILTPTAATAQTPQLIGVNNAGVLAQSGRRADEVVFTVEGDYVVARLTAGETP